jgi:hypothetical protein
MDNLYKLVNDGEIISITGDELLLITVVKSKIYQKYKINNPEVVNKLAGYPYWVFEYKDLLFTCNEASFFEAVEANDLFEVKLIRSGKYFNVLSYSIKTKVNALSIKIAKTSKIKGLIEKMKVSKLSVNEQLELVEWYTASNP